METSGQDRLVTVVLAAGRGTRMKSNLAKVLHPVLGRPMGLWPILTAYRLGAARVVAVIGHQAEEVESQLTAGVDGRDLQMALQTDPQGTGQAVGCAAEATEGFDQVLILCGDVPALDEEVLQGLLEAHRTSRCQLTVGSFIAPDPTGYGRIVRGEDGRATAIVEHRDCTDEQRNIQEVNAGVYVAERDALFGAVSRLSPDNAQGEYLLTDVVSDLASSGHDVQSVVIDQAWKLSGVNSRVQLAQLEGRMQNEIVEKWMAAGVSMDNPGSVRIEATVNLGQDTTLGHGVQLLGATSIGSGCHIEAGCVLRDTKVGDGVHLKPYVVADNATLEDQVTAGPFAHLRPGTSLGDGSKVGNFVETKNTRLEPGAKANHLSYLGDCEVGARANVGAGTITCNYDGVNKHRTIIGEEAFIGSDTQLVAPVTVGRRATVAAGSTVTEDVPDGALALSRAPQTQREGYDDSHRRPREAAKKAQTEKP